MQNSPVSPTMPDTTPAVAPDVILQTTEGDWRLSEALAHNRAVVLAFFHEAGTPSCQSEVSLLADAYETLRDSGAAVTAVSADSIERQRAFAERLGGVPFPLASDENLIAARAYNVVDEGDPRRSSRALFVINRGREVCLALHPFQPANLSQFEEVLGALGIQI
jgi:peroxiredoxin